MAGIKSMVVMVVLVVLASFQLQSTVAQTRHVVRDSIGWTIPPNGAGAYTTWATSQPFRVGDTLLFYFTTASQKVTVNVVGGSTPTHPASTSLAPAGSPPSSPDGTTSPPPPSPSSASSLKAVVPAAFLAVALAFVY
ncbi:cucumber peeling cupredoxin-like protein [Tanacetum coccineum]